MAEKAAFGSVKERKYAFRRFIDQVHVPDRRDPAVVCGDDECCVEEGWEIVVGKGASRVVRNVAKDLQDYLLTSMHVSVLLRISDDLPAVLSGKNRVIVLAEQGDLASCAADLSVPGSYRFISSGERIVVCGYDERGTAQGSYYIEDMMNLKEAPIVRRQDVVLKPVFSPRMVHSGWGMDQYPDTQLSAIAHNGLDAIIITITGIDRTCSGYQDINNLIDRASAYALDVYLYSNMKSDKHPDEPDAEAYYDQLYGTLFRTYPRAKGVILVGESIEFPSRDERTTGKKVGALDEYGLPEIKPSPGWWPCSDYPAYLDRIKQAIRKYKPDADLIFWTYNWGWARKEDRVALIDSLPADITLMVTFEMFEQLTRGSVTNVCVDYTIAFAGPGAYFTSEAEAARRRNIRLYTQSNTAGLTWDFGVIPYEPVPFQWARRNEALLDAHREYNLAGLIEAHHYGWWPSFVCEMAKAAFWEPRVSARDTAFGLACRDFGTAAAPLAVAAWEAWSQAIRYYIPTNEDQYGPFRIGPSYPLVFHPNLSRSFLSKSIKLPQAWHALTGNGIFFTLYEPLDDPRQTPAALRVDAEIESLETMAGLWAEGIVKLEAALEATPDHKRHIGARMLNLGKFMLNSVRTTIHVKQWWKLNMQLKVQSEPDRAKEILAALVRIAEAEIANAANTIPLVEADSRLGWEPTMDYMTDAEHLRWKIGQVRRVVEQEIPEYAAGLSVRGRALDDSGTT